MFNARTPVSEFRVIHWLRRVALLAVARLTVPAYFDPVGKGASLWSDLATTAAKVPATVIHTRICPRSGVNS